MYLFAKAFSPTRHQENFEIVVDAAMPDYGLWHREVNETVDANRRQLMEQLAANPPRFIVRLAFDCKRPTDVDLPASAPWRRDLYGNRMSNCPPRMTAFEDLEEWISENYLCMDPPVVDLIELHELKERAGPAGY